MLLADRFRGLCAHVRLTGGRQRLPSERRRRLGSAAAKAQGFPTECTYEPMGEVVCRTWVVSKAFIYSSSTESSPLQFLYSTAARQHVPECLAMCVPPLPALPSCLIRACFPAYSVEERRNMYVFRLFFASRPSLRVCQCRVRRGHHVLQTRPRIFQRIDYHPRYGSVPGRAYLY